MADTALYLEVDEDITSAIDKLRKSAHSSVQIVVPKRSSLLQSIINLKLLKKAADSAGKELVLVTNDKIAGDLAGRVGIPVAASIGARPVINEPSKPAPKDDSDEVIEADAPAPAGDLIDLEDTAPAAAESSKKLSFSRRDIDKPKPAAKAPLVPVADDEASDDAADEPTAKSLKAAVAVPKIPSFTMLQRRMAWVGLAVVLVVGYLAGMYFLSSANVKLFAVGTKVSVDGNFSVDTTGGASDVAKGVLAAETVTFAKDLNGAVTPTGQKDNGTKATGTMTITNCLDSNPHTFVAGTRFQAPDGKIFRSTEEIIVPGGTGSFLGCTSPGTKSVTVVADANGDAYNEAPATYSIPGLPASQQQGQNSIQAKGGQMSGGTSKISTVVTQADVDKAKAELMAKDKDDSVKAVTAKVDKDDVALSDAIEIAATAITPSPAVGEEAKTAAVSFKLTYTILAVKRDDYRAYARSLEQKQIGEQNQIYDDGLASAQIASTGKDASGRPGFAFSAVAYGGAKLDERAIATQLKGLKYGEATSLATGLPGVDDAEIKISPAWSTSMPKRAGKIRVTVSVASNK